MRCSAIKSGQLRSLAAAAIVVLACFLQASAQQELTPPKSEIKATVGASGFGDDNLPHSVFGGSVRLYVTRRLSVEPEFLYMYHSSNDQDYIVQPNLAFDLREPTKRVVPYVIAGVGAIHHRGRFFGFDFVTGAPRTFDTSGTTWTVSAGAGVKVFVTDRIFVSPEARIGREPNIRGTISVGYVFSGRKRDH